MRGRLPFPSRFPGAAGGSPLLLRPPRRGKGGGTPDLCCRVVNRVWRSVTGDGVSVEAAPARTVFWSSQIRLPLVGAVCSDDGSVDVSLRGRRGDDDVLVLWEFRPRACCRCAGVSSIVGVWLLRYVCGGLLERVGDLGAGSWSAGEGSACLLCGRPDLEDDELGARRRLIRLHCPDPPRRRWCLLQLINAMRLGVHLFFLFGLVGVRFFLGCEVVEDLLVVDLFMYWGFTCSVLRL